MGPYRSDWQRQKDRQRGLDKLNAAQVERGNAPRATDKQVRLLFVLSQQLGLTDDTITSIARRHVPFWAQDSVRTWRDLTIKEASACIKYLQDKNDD